jgi:hypothetical protein
MTDHPPRVEYFSSSFPKLFTLQGEYAPGLANLLGATQCWPTSVPQDHTFVDNKCTTCGIERRLL